MHIPRYLENHPTINTKKLIHMILHQLETMSRSEMKNAWRRNSLSKVKYSGEKLEHTIPQTTLRLPR